MPRSWRLIERLAADFTVFSEVGSKDAAKIMAPYRWVEQIETELAAGAWKVIAEARETGTAGIYRADGEVRMGLIDEIAHEVDPRRMVFEAPQKEQQVWFIERFGAEVNLGNICPADVLSLETLRLGLRSDTATRRVRDDPAGPPRRDRRQHRADPHPGLARHARSTTPGARRRAELAERVAGEGIASLWSSQLSRARETAEIVGPRLGLEPVVDERLAGRQPGRAGGPLVAGRRARGPRAVRRLATRRGDVPLPRRRVAAGADGAHAGGALADVRATGPLPALVVAHGGSDPGRALLRGSPAAARRLPRVGGPQRGVVRL